LFFIVLNPALFMIEAIRREPRHYVHSFYGPVGPVDLLLDLSNKQEPLVVGRVDKELPAYFVISRRTGLPADEIRKSFHAKVEELREIIRSRGKLPPGTRFPPGFR